MRATSFGAGANERGVLKRNVPMWLAEPELRAIVVSFATAAIPHGGEGALYIQLRKPERLLAKVSWSLRTRSPRSSRLLSGAA